MKSGNLNFLEASGPLQDCNGAALPLPFLYSPYLMKGPEVYTIGRQPRIASEKHVFISRRNFRI